jgi:hypothetical protein
MLQSKEVYILLTNQNIKHYEQLGYEIPKHKGKNGRISVPRGTKIIVNVRDLLKGSIVQIEIKCDYCGESFYNDYKTYLNKLNNSLIKKDCCKKCKPIKTKEQNLLKYGVKSTFELNEIKQKSRQSCLEKYGTEWYVQTDEYKERYKNTCLNKYNCENVFQNDSIKRKIVKSVQLKYGEQFTSYMQVPEIKDKSIIKINKSFYQNGTAPCSSQQKYLYTIIGGELNYPVENLLLDIAFPDEKIYLEYDGGGHNLSVKVGSITQEQFDNNEMKKYHFLKDKGWKMIRIISLKSKLPSDQEIMKLFNYAKDYLKDGHSWIKFDIDGNKVICSKFEKEYKINKKLGKTFIQNYIKCIKEAS